MITPVSESMVATAGLLLTHLPPDPGEALVVRPAHITDAAKETVGGGLTYTVSVHAERHPVDVSVHLNTAFP